MLSRVDSFHNIELIDVVPLAITMSQRFVSC